MTGRPFTGVPFAAAEVADLEPLRRQFADGAMPSRKRPVIDRERIGMVPANGDLLARQRERPPFDRTTDADQARMMKLFQTPSA